MPEFTRRQGVVAAGLGLALVACTEESIRSDLNTEGPPRVLAVAVLDESSDEVATYCTPDQAEKLNPYVCPEPGPVSRVTNARPIGWYTRIVFNELLDPETATEQLEDRTQTLATTQPVTLICGGEPVPYDGYYYLSGSHLTEVPGPALVIEPEAFVATGADCSIAVKPSVTDKDGNEVTPPAGGPITFAIAPLKLDSARSAPQHCATNVAPTASLSLRFNAYVNVDAAAGAITLVHGDQEIEVPVTYSTSAGGLVLQIHPVAPLAADTTYTLRVTAGVTDIAGGALAMDGTLEILFSTGATVTGGQCS